MDSFALPLSELQSLFQACIQQPKGSSDSFLSISKSNQERLDIYRNSIFLALENTMNEIYPACKKIVGDHFFSLLTTSYINFYPSDAKNILFYGKDFSKFIASFPPADCLPYLSDVAHLEYIIHNVFYDVNNAPIDFEKLTKHISQYAEQIIFTLPQGAVLLTSNYPILPIWEVCQPDYQDEICINFDVENDYLLIWQEGYKIRIEKLSRIEYLFLQLLPKQLPLIKLCEEFTHVISDVSVDQLLPSLCQRGCINYS